MASTTNDEMLPKDEFTRKLQEIRKKRSGEQENNPNSTSDPTIEMTTAAIVENNSQNILYLQSLLRSMDDLINMNMRVLNDREALEKQRKDEEKTRRQEAKERVRSLLARYENDALKLPLWRWKLKGVKNPASHLVLKGKTLLRIIVRSIIFLLLRPYMYVIKRKKMTRQAEREFLEKTLTLYSTSCDQWMSRIVRIPLLSLSDDDTIDFEFKVRSRFDFFNTRNIRNALQLKVRVKHLVESIVESVLPEEIISNLLVIMIDDGNYFKKDFLFESEKTCLEFDKLGATMIVCPEVDEAEQKNNSKVKQVGNIYVNISRSKMLLQNFLLVRILIGHIILSPWFHAICSKPMGGNRRKILNNYRVIASVVYILLTRIDPLLDKVEHQNAPSTFARRLSPLFDVENQAIHSANNKKVAPMNMNTDVNNIGDPSKIDESNKANHVVYTKLNAAASVKSILKREVTKVEIDEMLFNPRPIFEKLPVLHEYLYDDSYFAPAANLMEPWMRELQGLLDKWLDNLAVTVLVALRKMKFSDDQSMVGSASGPHMDTPGSFASPQRRKSVILKKMESDNANLLVPE